MDHLLKHSLLFGLLTTCLFLLSSCGRPIDHIGKTVAVHKRLNINASQTKIALWETGDISISYKVNDGRNDLTITGTVQISDSVLYTFPSAKSFYLYIYQLDPDGVATSKHDITPLFSQYATFPDKLQFTRTIPKDASATSFVFSYWGIFEENGAPLWKRSDDWEIYYNPFSDE